MAFRINSPLEVVERPAKGSDKHIVEGFDDGGLEGCGEKLLHLLQRVAVENILVIVALSYYGIEGSLGVQTYSQCVNITRELLTSLHDQALDVEEGEGEGDHESINTEIRERVRLREDDKITESEHSSMNSSQIDHPQLSSASKPRVQAKRVKNYTKNPDDFTSQPSVSENAGSELAFPPKPQISPNFGEKYLFDNTQVLPRVFNFPQFNPQSCKTSTQKRPNSYYADLAMTTSKFSTGSRWFTARKQGARYHVPNESMQMVQDHLNADLDAGEGEIGSKTQYSERLNQSTVSFQRQRLHEFTKITETEYKAAMSQRTQIVHSISKMHILELRSLQSPDSLLIKILNMICVMKQNKYMGSRTWDYLIHMLKMNSLKSELLILDPQNVQKDHIQQCVHTILAENLLQKAFSKGGIVELLMQFVLYCIKVHIGYHKFDAHRDMRQRFNRTSISFKQHKPSLTNKAYESFKKPMTQTTTSKFKMKTKPRPPPASSMPPFRKLNKTADNVGIANARLNMKRKSDLEIFNDKAVKPKIRVTKRPIFSVSPKKAPIQKPGKYIEPKRLILSDYKVLVPSKKMAPSIPIFNLHENLPDTDSREHLDEVEIPDIDLTNYENASLSFILNENVERPTYGPGKILRLHDVKRMMNEIPRDVAKLETYIDNISLDEKPTNVLVKLAEMCKKRRRKLYKDLRNPDSSSDESSSEEEYEDFNRHYNKYSKNTKMSGYNYRR